MIEDTKTRIEFENKVEMAKTISPEIGGRYAYSHDTGKCYWYSIHYTVTEIMFDIPGSLRIGYSKSFLQQDN